MLLIRLSVGSDPVGVGAVLTLCAMFTRLIYHSYYDCFDYQDF